MIEINLLPGAGKKPRGRSVGVNLAGKVSGVLAHVKDPWLLTAFAAVAFAIAGVSGMYWLQRTKARQLDDNLARAQQDSIRYVAVIREKRKAEARRDSVLRQVELIKSIDSKRFVWPHLMDEVSRAMPPFTWLTSVAQTNAPDPKKEAPLPKDAKAAAGVADNIEPPTVAFRIIGNTVDIQALTRFIRLLEASPFIENVTLVKSAMILIDGKEITEFQLDATYQVPEPSAIRTVPVSLSVR